MCLSHLLILLICHYIWLSHIYTFATFFSTWSVIIMCLSHISTLFNFLSIWSVIICVYSNFVTSWSIWSVIIYGYPHLHICHLLINLSLPYIIDLVSYLFVFIHNTMYSQYNLIFTFHLSRLITSAHVNLSLTPPPPNISLIVNLSNIFHLDLTYIFLFHFCICATCILIHQVALNSELPAGCERAPVFEHAPSSPILHIFRALFVKTYIFCYLTLKLTFWP